MAGDTEQQATEALKLVRRMARCRDVGQWRNEFYGGAWPNFDGATILHRLHRQAVGIIEEPEPDKVGDIVKGILDRHGDALRGLKAHDATPEQEEEG